MALPILATSNFSIRTLVQVRLGTRSTNSRFVVSCAVNPPRAQIEVNGRRSGNYPPSSWDYQALESLRTENSHVTIENMEEDFIEQIEGMKDKVKDIINDGGMQPLDKLELIDAVQRLGLEYHFENDIKNALNLVHARAMDSKSGSNNLHFTALLFRLLRHHGLCVRTDVFSKFMEEGKFKEVLREDMNGILSLYEASFHGFKGEDVIDKARAFALSHLKDLDRNMVPEILAMKMRRSLAMPLRWRSNRSEARLFMDIYHQEPNSIPILLRLAKLDFNLVQSYYRDEVRQLARWWMDLGLGDLVGLRDRMMETYLWGNMTGFEPRMRDFRLIATKIACFITVIDDCYDAYGTFEELELLTDFIDRWDIRGIDKLPPTIMATYWALYNTTNEIAYQFLRERGVNVLPRLQSMWATQCKAYLREARWYNEGYKPTLEEYLDNAVTSIGALNMLAYFLIMADVHGERVAFDFADDIPPMLLASATITRLNNDLATWQHELERGDNLKSVQCYMHQHGASEEIARDAIEGMVHEAWKSMNEKEFEVHTSFESRFFTQACLNMARASHFFYRYRDNYSKPERDTVDHLMSVVVEPVPI